MTTIELFEAMETCPSVRRLRERPVEEEKVQRILEAANFAPSGGNTQPWEFIVIKDPKIRRSIGALAVKGFEVLSDIGAHPESPEMRPAVERSKKLIEDYEKIPLLVIFCLNTMRIMAGIKLRRGGLVKHLSKAGGLKRLQQLTSCGSLFPALQNFILAARGLGLGTSITMPALIFEKRIREMLGIPSYVKPMAMVAAGYPRGRFIRPRRKPWTDIVHYEHW